MKKVQGGVESARLANDAETKKIALAQIPEYILEKQDDPEYQLISLLNWFKNQYFSWVNVPACEKCGNLEAMGEKESPDTEKPTEEDVKWLGSRIEYYMCGTCQVYTRFPRYQHPIKLFETRAGRCGEWANAFTALCISLGHNARKVVDWTDHVWTEVYLNNKWIHLDSCEPLFNEPMTYEKGWGKKLTYCIAFGQHCVTDVSRRYVKNYDECLSRRDLVSEKWLSDQLSELREKMWAGL